MPSSGASGGSTAVKISSSTNAVVTGAGRLRGVSGTTVPVTVYDSLTQTGSIIAETTAVTQYQSFGDEGVAFKTGLSVTSTGAVILHYVRN